MKNFHVIFGIKSEKCYQGNISGELCSDEFFSEYALRCLILILTSLQRYLAYM